jgi:Tol biopolymer transport system component
MKVKVLIVIAAITSLFALLACACANSDEATGQEETATDPKVSRLERTLTRVDLCPSSSPDGRTIVFPTRPRPQDLNNPLSVGGGDLTIINADGRGERRIAAFRGDDPDWSPDGTKILFLDAKFAGPTSIWAVSPDGTGSDEIATQGLLGGASWSPEGDEIAFSYAVSESGSYEFTSWLSLIDANGGHRRRVGDSQLGVSGAPAWSPDGTRVAFSDGATIEVLNRDGSDLHLVYRFRGEFGGEPAWSSDDRIAFVDGGDLYVIDAEGGDARRLTSLSAAGAFDSCPDWSSDGRHIAFSRSVGAGQAERSAIFVINADGSGEHQVTQTQAG